MSDNYTIQEWSNLTENKKKYSFDCFKCIKRK